MRIGYGYKRREGDFADLRLDRLWLDGEGTERSERKAMLNGGLRKNDVLVILSRGDLAHGKAINDIERVITERGATIEINTVFRSRARPGPKPEWEPTDDARFRLMWKDITEHGPYVVRKACEDAGVDATEANMKLFRSRLNRRYGTRKAT